MSKIGVEALISALSHSSVIEAITKGIEPMLTLTIDAVLKSRFDKLNDTIGKLMLDIKKREFVKKLQLENWELHDITAKQAEQIETLEGYTRVDNLLVYGLPETYAEVGLANSDL